jgi:hypothetical protein
VISYKLLGTAEWFVIHHTDCGMEFFTNDVMAELLDQSLETKPPPPALPRRPVRGTTSGGTIYAICGLCVVGSP